MELRLSQCILRPWQYGDEHSLVHHANNRNVCRNMRDIFPHPYTLTDAEDWLRKVQKEQMHLYFAVVIDGSAVGGIGLVMQEDVCRLSAEIGYWLGEKYWGQGIMTEAVRALTEYAFNTFNLCRIYAEVFARNTTSMRVLEKAGYSFEGRLRNAVFKDGAIMDKMMYAVLRDKEV